MSSFLLVDAILDQLAEQGYAIVDGLLSDTLLQNLHDDLHEQGLRPARIGQDRLRMAEVRGDKIDWLDGNTPPQQEFLGLTQSWQEAFNRSFYLGLNAAEFHYAYYPEGGGYQKHWDNFQGTNARVLTFITYLNRFWQPGDGGELVIYTEDDSAVRALVAPTWGTSVLFFSDRFPHQVMPAVKPRASVTGWFRRNDPLVF
ncbi:2OG-Fe(II) oxygenase [Balneatrix alpica]|uniref:2OG-Fe(II) oxygenase n=1 Tax=Balneatrix alpica TaxID=75684 RepID=A0ABV5ZD51_9GAMM|nr:2OG-Fe(II) oxygenase [Balneatrix alpica]